MRTDLSKHKMTSVASSRFLFCFRALVCNTKGHKIVIYRHVVVSLDGDRMLQTKISVVFSGEKSHAEFDRTGNHQC